MIQLKNVNKTFYVKDNEIKAVQDVSLHVKEGDIYGVIGYSGAGKSTFVRCLNLLEIPDSGEITYFDNFKIQIENGHVTHDNHPIHTKELNDLRKKIGMIFQHFNLLDRSTVAENIAYPLKHTRRSKKEIEERVKELLELVDLKDKANAYPHELSGGQKQRVAIARALANNPKILLSDEATSALDPDATESILRLLKDLNRKLNLTVILITHEMNVVKNIASRVAVMEDGKIVEEGSVYDIFASPKQNITKKFTQSTFGLEGVRKVVPEGEVYLLTFRNDNVKEALISAISRKFALDVNVILARVELLQERSFGQMVVKLEGERENVVSAISYLENSGVSVTEVKDV